MQPSQYFGLVLSGGGARGAYQAGILKGVAEIAAEIGIQDNPFKVVTGVSAGAINATYLASCRSGFLESAQRLFDLWSHLSSSQVFETGTWSVSANALRWLKTVSVGGMADRSKYPLLSLLNTAPLRRLIIDRISFEGISQNIASGSLDALGIMTTNYGNTYTITFVKDRHQGEKLLWQRSKRIGLRGEIGPDHVLASSAIPILFPPVLIKDHYYGDGCLRNTAPLSSAIHLGANRLLIVGVQKKNMVPLDAPTKILPSVGRVLSVVLNALFMDGVDTDLERMARINRTLSQVPPERLESMALRPIEYCYLNPSEDIAEIAMREIHQLPRKILFLLRGLGTEEEVAELVSYLNFEARFCNDLLSLGYQDAIRQKAHIADFLTEKPLDT